MPEQDQIGYTNPKLSTSLWYQARRLRSQTFGQLRDQPVRGADYEPSYVERSQ